MVADYVRIATHIPFSGQAAQPSMQMDGSSTLPFRSFNPPPAFLSRYPGNEISQFAQPIPTFSGTRPPRAASGLPLQLHAGPSTR